MLEEDHAEATSSCRSLKDWTAGSCGSTCHGECHSLCGVWLWKEYKNTSWATSGKEVLIGGEPLISTCGRWCVSSNEMVCEALPGNQSCFCCLIKVLKLLVLYDFIAFQANTHLNCNNFGYIAVPKAWTNTGCPRCVVSAV